MIGRRNLRWPALLLSAAALPAGAAEVACAADAPLVASLRLEYAVTASRGPLSLNGDGTIDFQRSDAAYSLEAKVQAFGIFEAQQRSSGGVGANGLVPRSYMQRSSRRAPRSVDFDWAAGQVSFSQNGEQHPTRPQMQDRLSLLLQLAWRSRAEPQAREFRLPVAGHARTSTYTFRAQGVETVSVAAGRFETVKFERHKDDRDDNLEVWLAPALCSLPVRVRFTDDNGLVIDQQLRATQPLPSS